MTCQDVQASLSLYIYGELDFAREEALEEHLAQCDFCQFSLSREKQLHTAINSGIEDPPLDLLAKCRQELRPSLARETVARPSVSRWWRWKNPFEISATRWSAQVALASMLVFIGFASARWFDRGDSRGAFNQASLLNPAGVRIRNVQPDAGGLVRIVVDQESEITGRSDDANIRSLLLAGMRQPDPGVRYYSVAILTGQGETKPADDLRAVLLGSVRNDPNPAVRLAAVEGLRAFYTEPDALETLKFVLQHDNNAGVRSQAIDILAPLDRDTNVTPAIAQTIEDVMRSAPDDEYVRARCSQALHEAKLSVIY
jgi:HEAT repeats/Putative zinc-finger